MAQLGLRISQQRHDTQLLLTVSPDQKKPENLPDGIIFQEAPSENPDDVTQFLHHWMPNAVVWLGPWMRPAVLQAARDRGIPSFLIDADEVGLENKRWRWLPDPISGTLKLYTRILARDAASGFRLRRLIGMDAPIEDSGPLVEDSPALDCNEDDLEDLGASLSGRPVWLAAHVRPDEIDTVLAAHRAAMRLSPRLLLILVPDKPADAPVIAQQCQDENWRVSLWDDAEMPTERTQILLAENRSELGLFFRVAPITFMGSSLVAGHGGRNPFEPAALGSAILYGPSVRRHLDAYSRLARAGAARIVKDQDTLTAALAQLMAPDQVAAMVHAGWETVSEGAVVADRIVNLVTDALDNRGTP